MPNRIIREGILTSERVEQLDPPAEVFYRRLMSKVDDHGLYDARPSILRTSLYPLRVDRVREADIARWIAACEKAGVIALYQHDGKPYLQMLDTRWQARSEAKFPLPNAAGSKASQAPANSCAQPRAAAPVFGGEDEDVSEDVGGKAARKRAALHPKPDDVDSQVWDDWVRLRKDKKATVSSTVVGEARAEADKAGLTLERFLRIWCLRGSQGLQASWLKQDEIAKAKSFRQQDAEDARKKAAVWSGNLLGQDPNTIDMEQTHGLLTNR